MIYKIIENTVYYTALIIITIVDFIIDVYRKIKKFLCALYNLTNILERIEQMAINLNLLAAEVTRVQTVQASAVTLLTSLTKELESISADLAAKSAEGANDAAALNELIDKLKVSTDDLATAVATVPSAPQTEETQPQP